MQWTVAVTQSAYGPGMSKTKGRATFGSLEEAKDVFLTSVANERDCRIYLTERDGQYSRAIMEAKVL